jgi:shikimate kinase
LVLIGFMGTGKSAVGKRVARSLGFSFLDTDVLIEQMSGKTIARIFEEEGEDYFRQWEAEALRRSVRIQNAVIATGGGIVTREENRRLLTRAGHVVWMKTDPEIILERVSRRRIRPLLRTENPRETIARLLKQRTEWYRQSADEIVDTSNLTLEETVHGLAESARVALARVPGVD